MNIAIINSSTVVSDADGQKMVIALNLVLPQFCIDWSLPKYTVVYIPKGKPSPIPLKVFLLDTSDVEGTLGYHSLNANIPSGKCFAKTILVAGGVPLYSPSGSQTIAQCLSHEVFELLVDPICNSWWDIGDGKTLVAREMCDPVQGNDLIVTIVTPASTLFDPKTRRQTTTPAMSQKVGLSDWILPAWANPQNTKGPFNHLKTLKAPFTLGEGGYAIQITNGAGGYARATKFGSGVTDQQKTAYTAKKRVLKRMI